MNTNWCYATIPGKDWLPAWEWLRKQYGYPGPHTWLYQSNYLDRATFSFKNEDRRNMFLIVWGK